MKSILCLFLLGLTQTNLILADSDNDSQISPATPVVTEASILTSTSPMQPIMRAIEIIEFVSKFSNSESEGFGVAKIHSSMEVKDDNEVSSKDRGSLSKTNDPLTALSSLAIYGFMKISSLLLSMLMYFVTMFNPGAWSSGNARYVRNWNH